MKKKKAGKMGLNKMDGLNDGLMLNVRGAAGCQIKFARKNESV